MQTKGDQYERWKQATSKELQAFSQDSVEGTHGGDQSTLLCEEIEGGDAATRLHHEADDSGEARIGASR